MISHVVLLQPKVETTAEEMERALNLVREMRELIPGITTIETGKNLSRNHKGYEYGFIVHFADETLFRAYAPHPAHQPVSEELQRICREIIDFDIRTREE
jgi:hypothetical protein